VVINTCTVTASADSEAGALARRAKRLFPASRVCVTGCLAQDRGPDLWAWPEVDVVVTNDQKANLFERVARASRESETGIQAARTDPWIGGISRFESHRRAIVKVQDGCGFACAFCLVPRVRGKPRSRPIEEIVSGARRLAEGGVRELVLTGIQLASYGKDRGEKNEEPRLALVVERILAVPGIRRVRLSSYAVADFEEALLPFLKRGLCPHVHLPLQSGDPGVLKSMRRPYRLEDYEEILAKIRETVPDAGITTDLIAGFPGESPEAFENTLRAARRFAFADFHPFPYSERPGTAAASFGPQVPPGEVKRRMKALKELKKTIVEDSARRAIGKTWDIVAERHSEGLLGGTTDRGLKVVFPGEKIVPGQELLVRVRGFRKDRAEGEVISYRPDR
jgi:threonylcarbamoyladenosine tRNA methylthiotransferase MtaB